MQNRAKCKKCESVIESFHSTDYVECKCGEVSVSGGSAMYCAAIDWKNFVRVDDRGNEVITKVVEEKNQGEKTEFEPQGKPGKKELIGYLEEMIKSYENLPERAKDSFITARDHEALLVLLLAILTSEKEP